MIYTTTSAKEVIQRIIANTRLQDSSYIAEMEEWIPQGMGQLQTRTILVNKWKDVKVNFHKARIPCGTIEIKAVQSGGGRLEYLEPTMIPGTETGYGKSNPNSVGGIPDAAITPFVGKTGLTPVPTEDGVSYQWHTDIRKLELMECNGYYYTEMDYIVTSVCDGKIRVHYKAFPVDEDGFPLIPDEENYKEALYWYVRAKMVGAGWDDKQFNEGVLMERFELYGARAIAKISYPSVEQKDAMVSRMTRLIMPENYWS